MNLPSPDWSRNVPARHALWLPLPTVDEEATPRGRTKNPRRRKLVIYFEEHAWQPPIRVWNAAGESSRNAPRTADPADCSR